MAKRVIADEKEIMKIYTNIIRSEEETTANRLKATELLAKIKDKNEKHISDKAPTVLIVDDIPKETVD